MRREVNYDMTTKACATPGCKGYVTGGQMEKKYCEKCEKLQAETYETFRKQFFTIETFGDKAHWENFDIEKLIRYLYDNRK